MRRLFVAVMLLVGCDGASDGAVVGEWLAYGGDCTTSVSYAFTDGGSYTFQRARINGDRFEVQRESGAFVAGDGELSLSPRQSACGALPATFAYDASPSRLMLGADAFAPMPPDGANRTTPTLGCFVGGAFVAQ